MLLGHHIVKPAYGRWLPGDERGQWSAVWDKQIGRMTPAPLQAGNKAHERLAASRMPHPPVTFDRETMATISDSIRACEAASEWSVAAMAIEPTHLHLLVTGIAGDPNATCQWIAQQTAKAVHTQTSQTGPVWAKGKWCSRIEDEAHWQNAIVHINRHSGAKAAEALRAPEQPAALAPQKWLTKRADNLRGFTIISGGQTGVDRAALDFAIAAGLSHGGWTPRGRRAEDGPIDRQYQLRETPSSRYAERTEWNLRDSDATLVFSRQLETTGGTRLTIDLARRRGKPWLQLVEEADKPIAAHAAALRGWLLVHGVETLNVAGPRASQAPGIGRFVGDVLTTALSQNIG